MTRALDQDPGYTVTGYFQLVEKGYLEADDRVELLEGLVVASPPPGPLHASITMRVERALRLAIGERASLRLQMPLVIGSWSAPEQTSPWCPASPKTTKRAIRRARSW